MGYYRALAVLMMAVGVMIRGAEGRGHALLIQHRKLSGTMEEPDPLVLNYHNGPLLTGDRYTGYTINLYLVWYGPFTFAQRSIVTDFVSSLNDLRLINKKARPMVSSWWKTTRLYTDRAGVGVGSTIKLAGQTFNPNCSLGMHLTSKQIEKLVTSSQGFSRDVNALYLVLTSSKVTVDGFCVNSCGFHDYLFPDRQTQYRPVPYMWVGNPGTQCPGFCAWPYALPQYGPQTPPLTPPNGDIGIDGLIINLATVLAGVVSNPYDTGYYQGDPGAPLGAVSACTGIFGPGAYPGHPGDVLQDPKTKASYNAWGKNNREFLIPAVWSPSTLKCTFPS